MGRRCKNQVWDGRTNIVTVAPAEPSLTQSAETAMIISRLLIITLGILWILLLLTIGGSLGVDAANVPVAGGTHAAPAILAGDSTGNDGHSIGAADDSKRSDTGRDALLGEALGWHRKGELGEAAAVYSRLLEVVPNDPDGLHLLGLVRYGQGNLVEEDPERNNDSKALFEEAELLVKSALSSAVSGEADIFSMRRNLGEILRAKGDLEEAVMVLRDVIQEQDEAGIVREHQASLNLAVTLVEIVTRTDSAPRGRPSPSENHSGHLSKKPSKGTRFGSEEWELRREAQHLLLRELSRRPDDKRVTLKLARLFVSNWGAEKESGGSQSEVDFDDEGSIYYDRDGNIIEGFFDDSLNGVMNGNGWETRGRRDWGEEAVFWFDRALALDPSDDGVALESATMLHRIGRTEEAQARYIQIIQTAGAESGATRDFARSNLAALRQESGDYAGAIEGYRELLAQSPDIAIALNNLGAALQALGEHDEGTAMLEKSLQLEPLNTEVMANLGTHWQEEGDLDRARSFYARAEMLKRDDAFLVRRAIMLHPVMPGEEENIQEIENLAKALDHLIGRDPPLLIPDPSRGAMRVHFYLVYRGGNQRAVQEKVARMYTRASPGLLHLAPSLEREDGDAQIPADVVSADSVLAADEATTAGTSMKEKEGEAGVSTEISTLAPPLRVGFVSKFFGDQEPHGMLLEGVMRHLPRKSFHVTVCPINAPGRRVSPRLVDAADEVVSLPTKLEVARNILGSLRLDVLVYADMNSEPVSHFLGYARLARVQAVFWGNPITTGNPSIDYFVSADVMESQRRTALSKDDETYSEQVVLLGGQGIWYDRLMRGPLGLGDVMVGSSPEAAKASLRRGLKSRLGVEEDSVIFMCSQSLFKLKPDFDLVLRDILLAFDCGSDNHTQSPENAGKQPQRQRKEKTKAYLVLTDGRRKRWTEAFWRRLHRSVPEIIPQVRMLPRTSAGTEFHKLLASADVILHPFPFGGSKTSADGMALGVPVVAMEGDALPGRMAFSLYTTMGLEGSEDRGCCVARDRDSYVQLAIRLGRDARYREWAGDLIGKRSVALWERRGVVFEWARFISRAAGRPSPAAEEVGLVAGADLPLPPPEPFQPQHQEHTQPIAQQLSQPLPDPVSEGEILQKQHPAQEEAALQPAPVQLSTGLSTRASREVSQEISTGTRQTEQTGGRPEAAPTTKTYAVADVIDVTKNSNLAAGTTGSDHETVVDAKAGGGDFDRGEEGEGRSTTSHLLGRFAVLHREGRLEEAAATLQQALHIMESKRRNTVRRGVGRQQDSDLLDASSIVDEDGTGPNSFAEDSKRAQLGETKSLGRPEKGKISAEREVVAGGGRLVSEAEASAIAGVMNDLGCTLQQLWRLDEAETMLRGAIENRLEYSAAMTNLGVVLQAKNQLDEAESWYREALRLSRLDERDSALTNLALLMRADGDRLKEAVDLIIRETSAPPLHRGGAIIAALSLLLPRPTHRQTFRRLGEGEAWSKRFGRSYGIWEEVRRLRELYPVSTNNLVLFLGLLEGLGGVVDILWDVAGMEPLFLPEDEQSLLPQELHPAVRGLSATTNLGTGLGGRNTQELGQDKHKPIGGGGAGDHGGEEEFKRRGQVRGKLEYDRHSVHVVTQYYVPDDHRRAREIDACLLHNLRNPFVGTVHIFVDYPDAVRHMNQDQRDPVAVHVEPSPWIETDWRPPFFESLEKNVAGKARVIRLSTGRRMAFGDAIRYSNHFLSNRVVLLSNSDIAFDESLARLGDPSTLDMDHKVFALAAWQSKLVSANMGDPPPSSIYQDQDSLQEHFVVGEPEFFPRTDSQDAWIFRSPLPSTVADATGFEMGQPRCDGRLAQVLLDAGYSVTSPSLSLVTRHVHSSSSASPHHGPSASNYSSTASRASTYRGETQVAGNIASVPISDQWLF